MIYLGIIFLLIVMSTYSYICGHKNGNAVGRRQVITENIIRLNHQNRELQEEADKWHSSI